MLVKKNDFIEIEFTGYANGQIFDTTNKKDADKSGLNLKDIKLLTISIGNQMVIQGLDEDLEGKEIDIEYSVTISPEKAFGKRNPNMIKTYGINHFRKQNINPYVGLTLQLDDLLAKIISVNGGRVTIDFNNPLAGKNITYKYKINKIVAEDKDKINSLQDFFFRKRFDFEIKDKKVIFKDDKIKIFIDLLSQKFKEMTGLEFVMIKEDKDKIEAKNNS